MATDSILPLTVDNTSHNVDPLLDLDSILLSTDFSANDALLSGLLATDQDFLNDLFNPPDTVGPTPLLSDLSPPFHAASSPTLMTTDSVTAYPMYLPHEPYQPQGEIGMYDHSPHSSEDQYSPPWSTGGSTSGLGPTVSEHSFSTSPGPKSSPEEKGGWFGSEIPITQMIDPSTGLPNMETVSKDVHIDVEFDEELEEEEDEEEKSTELKKGRSSERKTGSLTLTEEEQKLLAEEGIHLPTDMPLTKAEERHLKRVRRKIKNKQSAAESRKRKKEYVDGLEKRVEKCTAQNLSYKKKIHTLEEENKSLLSQLRRLQALVSQYNPTKLQTGSFLMILVLSFSLLIVPRVYSPQSNAVYTSLGGRSRTLLDVQADEFGNVIDPDTGQIINDRGVSAVPPPPWRFQSPALNMNSSPHLSSNVNSPDL